MTRSAWLPALALAAAAAALGEQPPAERAEILVLGTYHMANPGHDIFNMQADDVLSDKRQAEMAELIGVLKKFRPTKIAVEREANDKRIAKDYADFLAGKHELTRNEIEQIGFRLARELGHKATCAVDADGDFPYPRLVKYAKATGRSKELDEISGEVGEMVKAQGAYLGSHTILETLLYMNSDDRVTRDVGYYMRQARFGEPYDWAGADLVSDWFRRKMRIFSNIAQLAESSNDRILVIYGAGHLGWLRGAVAADPTLRLRKLAEFAR